MIVEILLFILSIYIIALIITMVNKLICYGSVDSDDIKEIFYDCNYMFVYLMVMVTIALILIYGFKYFVVSKP